MRIAEVYPFQKYYRILACVSSFKRPIFVSGQVLRLMHQSYPVDVSLSVKGVPEDNLFHKLGRTIGDVQERVTPRTDLVFGWQYPSVMRGNYIK